MSDNGKDLNQEKPPEKTSEQLASERLSRYLADPDKFVEMSEMVVCVKRTSIGPAMFIHGDKTELQIAWAEINEAIMGILRQMKLKAAMERQKIVPAKHGILNFARRK